MIRSRALSLVALLVAALFAGGIQQSVARAEAPPTYRVVQDVLVANADGELQEPEATVVAQFVVNTNLWDTAAGPVSVSYNGAGAVPGGLDLPGIIEGAILTWNAASPATFTFANVSASTGDTGSCGDSIHLDGLNTIAFAPLDGMLARTCTVYLGDGPTSKVVEFDMQLSNDPALWSSADVTPAGRFDLNSTILHELGHAAGLSHSAAGTVMDGTLAPGTQRRALTPDDVAGLRAAYPLRSTAATSTTKNESSPLTGKKMFQLRAAFLAHD